MPTTRDDYEILSNALARVVIDRRHQSDRVGEMLNCDDVSRASARLIIGQDAVQYSFDKAGELNLIVIPVWKISETACDEFKALAELTPGRLSELRPPKTEGLPYELNWNGWKIQMSFGEGEDNHSLPREMLEKVVISADGQSLAEALQLEGNA